MRVVERGGQSGGVNEVDGFVRRRGGGGGGFEGLGGRKGRGGRSGERSKRVTWL